MTENASRESQHMKLDTSWGVSGPATRFESYDEDLEWIIERLVERTGGTFGVISRHLVGEADGSIIAQAKSMPRNTDEFQQRLLRAVRSVIPVDPVVSRATQVSEWTWSREDSSFESYRSLSLSFWPSPSVNLVASVFMEKGFFAFTLIHRSTAKILYPVLSRYIHLWWLHRTERSRANAYRTALDIADVGVILLDRRLQLIFANARAKATLCKGNGLRLKSSAVEAESRDDAARLQVALQHARLFNEGGQIPVRIQRSPLLALARSNEKRPLIVSVLGLDRPAVDTLDPAVIIYLLDPTRDLKDLLTPLCNIYKLTNAESRLTYLLVSGLTLAAAAAQLKIRNATARSYLKQVFSKTDTNRQAELVRLLLTSLQRINTSVQLELI
jgi:DNA-binding CsgD family transcriptional regulator